VLLWNQVLAARQINVTHCCAMGTTRTHSCVVSCRCGAETFEKLASRWVPLPPRSTVLKAVTPVFQRFRHSRPRKRPRNSSPKVVPNYERSRLQIVVKWPFIPCMQDPPSALSSSLSSASNVERAVGRLCHSIFISFTFTSFSAIPRLSPMKTSHLR